MEAMRAGRRWRAAGAAFALVVVAACGSHSDPSDDPLALPPGVVLSSIAPPTSSASAPVTTASTAPADANALDDVRLQPGDRRVEFRRDPQVGDEVLRFIVETLRWVHTDLGDSGPLIVHVHSDEDSSAAAHVADLGISDAEARRRLTAGELAFTSPGGHIWIYLPNFQNRSELNRRVAVFHEYVHTLQYWQAEVTFQSGAPQARFFMPRWIVEGCAEYLAVKDTARRRLLDERKARESVVARAKASAEPLEAIETGGKAAVLGGEGEAYTLGWLGCERLAQSNGEDAVLHRFWLSFARLREWKAAFADAFGVTPADFYADFEAFRATL